MSRLIKQYSNMEFNDNRKDKNKSYILITLQSMKLSTGGPGQSWTGHPSQLAFFFAQPHQG